MNKFLKHELMNWIENHEHIYKAYENMEKRDMYSLSEIENLLTLILKEMNKV